MNPMQYMTISMLVAFVTTVSGAAILAGRGILSIGTVAIVAVIIAGGFGAAIIASRATERDRRGESV